jgi:UDP-glucose 4-epimerase
MTSPFTTPAALLPNRPAFQRVAVTGAAGFIGSRVTALLHRLGVEVLAIDNLSVGLPLPAAAPGLVPVEADIRDRAAMQAILARHQPQAVVHLAAVHHIPTCEAKPWDAFEVNVMGTQSVLEAAQAVGADVLLASSGAVYDWTAGALGEDSSPLKPSDVYSITKLDNEYQLAGWAARTGRRAMAARLFNTIGTGDPNGHLIPDVLKQIGQGGAAATIALGNTAPRRDYIHVDDVASALVTLLGGLPAAAPFEAFNVCTGRDLSVAELVGQMADLMGVAVTITRDPARIRKVDRLEQLGNPAKLAQRFGWQAQWDARSALAQIMAATGYSVAPQSAAA